MSAAAPSGDGRRLAGFTVEDARASYPEDPRPPRGAPNVVAIVLDDTGFAQLAPFGSDIATPNIERLSDEGLRYNRFHVTALCSPTRASFLTGRNHHAVGMGFLTDIPVAFPGYTARIPASAATLPRILRQAGYSTFAVGKWHLTPRFQRSAAGPFDLWPLGLGFERYYGFLGGDANHWTPNLVRDNGYVDPPATPEEGYHLSEDLADRSIMLIQDQQQAAPGKPFFLYLAFGAMHAPHHVHREWVEPYRGQFDGGWESWREGAFGRQLAQGVVPEGTVLTPRPEWVEAWDDLPAEHRRMHARMQETFAGFLTHTDAQIGRVVSYLEQRGILDDTLILVFSDNGASAEGGRAGSVNEHRFTARIPESMDDNLAAYDDWGGFSTYNHYSWGWAWAGNAPLRLWKRYTWLGGTRTPLVIRWPKGIEARGAVRSQFAHVIDLFPTVLDACGLESPASVDGVAQQPVDGASLRPTFDDPDAPDPRTTQYFEMMGSRSIYHDGWKATTDHLTGGVIDEDLHMTGSREFSDDRWSLFHLAADFSESTDLSAQEPGLTRNLEDHWLVEAARNQVLPLADTLLERFQNMIFPAYPPATTSRFTPGGSPISDETIPFLAGGFRATAVASVPESDPDGVLFAIGDLHGGYALFVADGRLSFTFSRAGIITEVVADTRVPGGRHELGVTCVPRLGGGSTLTLLHDDHPVGSAGMEGAIPPAVQHGGAGLRIGHDTGFAVSSRYRCPATWTGTIEEVVFVTPGGAGEPRDELRAALHHD